MKQQMSSCTICSTGVISPVHSKKYSEVFPIHSPDPTTRKDANFLNQALRSCFQCGCFSCVSNLIPDMNQKDQNIMEQQIYRMLMYIHCGSAGTLRTLGSGIVS